MQEQIMLINIEEAAHAFRVNGVTFAKRHLVNTMAKDTNGDTSKMLAKFLVIVPFLATSFELPENASESVRYGTLKSKRLYEALKITEENTVPFMLVAMAQAGEDIASMGRQVKEAGFYGEKNTKSSFRSAQSEESNVIQLGDRSKHTLH